MGLRIAELQNFFAQSGPVLVSCRIGSDLSSSFSLVVNSVLQVSENQVVLRAHGGEILLHEKEIYRFGPSDTEPGFALVMDGGTALRIAPVPVAPVQPVF